MPRCGNSSSLRQLPGGPCIAIVVGDDGKDEQCGACVSSFWYGKGKTFCAAHRAAWQKSKAQAEDAEELSYVSEVDEMLGSRYCEPSMMKPAEKFNDVKKSTLQLCVQGTSIPNGYERGNTDTRWQSIEELVASVSREDFDRLTSDYVKELQKSFKRDAKRFKTAAQLARE